MSSTRKSKKAHPKVGDVFAIEIRPQLFGFGVVAVGDDCALFAFSSPEAIPDLSLDKLCESIVAFRVYIAWDAFKASNWKVIGHVNLFGSLAAPAEYWHQSVGTNVISLVSDGVFSAGSEEEARGLEQYSIWFGPHVESRLDDFFGGRPSPIHEEMSKVRHYDPATGQSLD